MLHRILFCILSAVLAVPSALLAHDPHDPIETVAVSPNYAQDKTVLAATGGLSIKIGIYALLKSTDGGVNWSVVAGLPNNSQINSIAFSPAYAVDQTIYSAGTGGLFSTTNQGSVWSMLLKSPLLNVTLSPNFANDNTMLVVTMQKTILESTNRGQTWTALTLPAFSSGGPTVIAVSPNFAVDKTLLLGSTADGIFKSADGGMTWTQTTSGMTLASVTALCFSPAFATDQRAFAATLGTGVLITANGGSTWMISNMGITDLFVSSLSLSPTYLTDSTIWITTAVAGVFRSGTQGRAWTLRTSIPRALSSLTCVHYQNVAPTGGGASPVLFLSTYEGLWTSGNGAVSWYYIDTLPTRIIRHINISPSFANDQTVFASTYGSGNLWSVSAGSSWTFRNTGMLRPYTDASGISPNYAADGIAFSSNEQGLERLSATGWQLMQGLRVPTYPRSLAISPNFAEDSTVMIGLSATTTPSCAPPDSANTGVFLSTDRGNTWASTSLTGVAGVISIAISPGFATDKTAFVASPNSGLYVSTDGGMTWTSLTTPSKSLATVVLSPGFATDNTIFATGLNAGIFQSIDRGVTWTTLPNTTSLRVLDLQISPNYTNDQSFFAGTIQMGLLQFTNGGTAIVPVTSFPDQLVTAVGISPNYANDQTLFAAGYHGIYKSTNLGSTWTNLAAPARVEESQNIAGPLQEPPTITFEGAWSFLSQSAYASTSAFAQTGEAQDTAVLNFMGSGVGWVTLIGPNQGSATVTLDGGTPTTVSLNASMNQYQHVVWQRQGLTCGLHTLTITGMPQTGQTVSLDAFNVWVTNCPLN